MRHQTHEDEDALLAMTAAVTRRGLELPALFLLEVVRPLRLPAQQVLFAVDPLLRPWAGDRLSLWASLLDDDQAFERTQRLLAGSARLRPH